MNDPRPSPDRKNPVDRSLGSEDWTTQVDPTTDDFNRLILLEAGKRGRNGNPVSVLQIDCDNTTLGFQLARNGAQVLSVSARAEADQRMLDAIKANGLDQRLRLLSWCPQQGRDTTPLPGTPFDIVVCPNALSYLPYGQAHNLLRRLALMTRIGGKLFISAYGIHSDLCEAYPDENQPVRQRFSPLAPELARKYGIDQPVCLYSERDLFLLLFEAGLSVVKTFSTTHGNVKAVAVRM